MMTKHNPSAVALGGRSTPPELYERIREQLSPRARETLDAAKTLFEQEDCVVWIWRVQVDEVSAASTRVLSVSDCYEQVCEALRHLGLIPVLKQIEDRNSDDVP